MRILIALAAAAAAAWGLTVVIDPPPGQRFEDSVVEGESFPLAIRSAGCEFRLERPPTRIVSVFLSADEIILNLVPPDRLAAVTRWSATPGSSNVAHLAAKVKGRVVNAADVEHLLSFEPDLVVVGYYTRPAATRLLLQTRVPVLCLREPESIDDIVAHTRLLGRVLGETDRAEEIASRIEEEAGERRPGPVRVYYWIPTGYTLGQRSLVTDLIERSGGINVVQVQHHARAGPEQIMAADPDVLLIQAWSPEEKVGPPEALRSLRCVREGRVAPLLSKRVLTSSPEILEGLADVRKALSR
jgi:iron complex transport system substrate-binding protein